jgi:nitrogen regulatory protein P-II 1
MAVKKITAIIDELLLESVEKNLVAHGVTGFTITQVKGRGYYYNSYSQDKLIEHYQIDIYTAEKYAVSIAKLIMQVADINIDGEGFVAITSVDQFFWIKKQNFAQEDDFNYVALEQHNE